MKIVPGFHNIRWEEIHQAIHETLAVLEGTVRLSEEKKRALLQERARRLAGNPPSEETSVETFSVLTFKLAQETYALELSWIHSVFSLVDLTPIPCTPSFIMGVVTVQGEIVTVLDSRKLLGLPCHVTETDKVVLLNNQGTILGIHADAVLGLAHYPMNSLQRPKDLLNGNRSGYIQGIFPDQVILLDGKELLSTPQIIVHEEVLRTDTLRVRKEIHS